jgi:hypothetical protein
VALLADEPRRLVGAFHGAAPVSILRSERPAPGSAIPGLIGCCAHSSQSIPREFRDSAEPIAHRRLRLQLCRECPGVVGSAKSRIIIKRALLFPASPRSMPNRPLCDREAVSARVW